MRSAFDKKHKDKEIDTMEKAKIDVAVLILFFNRPHLLKKVFEQVKKARPSRLYLYQDGPRKDRPDDIEKLAECQKIVSDIDWECEVHTNYQTENRGCDPSEYLAQKWMFSQEEMGIVLEDDDVPSQSFFPFCLELLKKYKDDPRIDIICGMNNTGISKHCSADYLFSRSGSISGWASWRRVIDSWDETYAFLDDPEALNLLKGYFHDNGRFRRYIRTCREHKNSGREHYESILSASAFFNHRLNIVPAKNLISNIGNDGESTHGVANVNMLPKGIRRIFNMPTYEYEFPLKHPRYVIEDMIFFREITNIMYGRNCLVPIYRKIASVCLRLRYGDFAGLWKGLKRRLKLS